MSRVNKLKRLKDEVGRLFYEGLDVNAVVDQLRTDEQFAEISFEQVQAFYTHLQEKFDTEMENERQIAVHEQRIVEHQQQIAEYQHQTAEYQEQIAEHESGLAREQQIKTEMKFVTKYWQNSNKFLLYDDDSFVNPVVCKNFWQRRFFMITKTTFPIDNTYTIKFQDLFQSATKSFTIQKLGVFLKVYTLTFPFVLFHEFVSSNDVTYFRLLKFNFESGSLEVVQSLEFNGRCQLLVSAFDASKFLLRRKNDVNECNLKRGQIQIGKELALGSVFNFYRGSYFDKEFYGLQFVRSVANQFGNRQLTQIKILHYNLEQNESSIHDLNSTPENFNCLNPSRSNYSAWIRDTVFVTIEFSLTGKHGIIFTNPQMRNWKFVDFATDLEINCIQSFVDGTLMICSQDVRQRKRKIYRLQMRKPDFLRNMAWITIIKLFKEAKIKNPYEEARQYLPLNSEIQPFVFSED